MNGSERGNSGVHVGFILLANSATINIFTNEEGEAGLPEFGGN